MHFPHEIDWDHLPERCVIQIHWYPNPEFVARLAAQNVRVVVLARHPMDVLMSWLNLVYYKHETAAARVTAVARNAGLSELCRQ